MKIRRILCNNGYFIIAFLDRETSIGKLLNQNRDSGLFFSSANIHSSEEIKMFLIQAGFELEEKRQTVFTLENRFQETKDGTGDGVFAVFKAKKL